MKPIVLRAHDYSSYKGWSFWLLAISLTALFGNLLINNNDLDIISFIYPASFIVFFLFYIPVAKKRRILITDNGIIYKSGYPTFLQNFSSDWEIEWDEIRYACLNRSNAYQAKLVPLLIQIQAKTLILIPAQWIDPNDGIEKPTRLLDALFGSKKRANYRLQKSPLIRAFLDRDLLKNPRGDEGMMWADLSQHPVTLGMMIYLIFSILYFVVELVTLREAYVYMGVPYNLFFIAMLLIGGLSYWLLLKLKLNSHEKIILSLLVGLATGLISSQLFLRINAWTAINNGEKYSYSLVEKAYTKSHWKSTNNQLPDLIFGSTAEEYWRQFSMGDSKAFEVRKGGLGFYQINLKTIDQEQKEFYLKKTD